MEQKPTPEQMERARMLAGNHAGYPDGAYWEDDYRLALSAILQSDQQQAERIAELEGIVKRVQSAAKTIMHHEGEELSRLREKDRTEWQALRSLDSEREMNAILTAENEKLEAQQAELKTLAEAMAGALDTAMQWINAWDVGFLFDEEWPEDEAKINNARTAFREWQGGRSDG